MAKSTGSWIPKLVVVGAVAVAGVFLFPSLMAFLKRATGTASAASPQQQKSSGGGAGSGSGGGPAGSNTSGLKALSDLVQGFLNGSLITNTADIQSQIDTLSNHGFGQWWDSITSIPDMIAPTADYSGFDFYAPGNQGALLNDVLNSIPVAIPVFTGGGDPGGGGGGGGDTTGDIFSPGFLSEDA